MNYYDLSTSVIIKELSTDKNAGLTDEKVQRSRLRYGKNKLTPKKPKSIVKRFIDALLEPMMLILLVAFCITLGVNIGKVLKGESCDFYECIGIFIAIAISVTLTVVMESKSEKAFRLLEDFNKSAPVKVVRNGKTTVISKEDLVVGDVVVLDGGKEVPADGRIIECSDLYVEEAALTGESLAVKKSTVVKQSYNPPLAERFNCLFSGTFVERGSCKYVVTAVGNDAEIGKIAKSVTAEKSISAPLNEKLSRLGKMVTWFGEISSAFVFILSLIKLILTETLTFDSAQEVFIQSIVLIVAAVPEGLPTTVAISLTLNVLRLAKSNALIRKLVATETVGCVSVICTDKTGTLTDTKTTLSKIVANGKTYLPDKIKNEKIIYNAAVNSTADLIVEKGNVTGVGSTTETALLKGLLLSGADYRKIRESCRIRPLTPFSSQIKYMETEVSFNGAKTVYLKGAPEVVLSKCLISEKRKNSILEEIASEQKVGGRVIAFASSGVGSYVFDGYAVISNPVRKGVRESVESCKRAGISVIMLTGDNLDTAKSVALDAGITLTENSAVTADYIEGLSDERLKKEISKITVIARSTPQTKLRVVTALQKNGEVVAVTGDGVNDAPAMKHADVGISMGDGTEITKQASDVVLLDNSFTTILKAISFGRNVYANFQRFITFQLTVNLASICIILSSLLSGFEPPFSSACLLWLNVIMDGPLALSLGLENRKIKYLSRKPVKRDADVLSGKMLLRIGLHALFACVIVTVQRYFNFLGVKEEEQAGVTVTAFVLFQVFNAINCREISSESSFKGVFDNKLLLIMIVLTYGLQALIVTTFPTFFGVKAISFQTLIKLTALCPSIIAFSEGYKLIYRIYKKVARRKTEINPKISINEKDLGYVKYK